MKSLLIADTTKEEREKIVLDGLGYCGLGCDDATNGYDFYKPYIEGELELRELTMRYRTGIVKAEPDREPHSCTMGAW